MPVVQQSRTPHRWAVVAVVVLALIVVVSARGSITSPVGSDQRQTDRDAVLSARFTAQRSVELLDDGLTHGDLTAQTPEVVERIERVAVNHGSARVLRESRDGGRTVYLVRFSGSSQSGGGITETTATAHLCADLTVDDGVEVTLVDAACPDRGESGWPVVIETDLGDLDYRPERLREHEDPPPPAGCRTGSGDCLGG